MTFELGAWDTYSSRSISMTSYSTCQTLWNDGGLCWRDGSSRVLRAQVEEKSQAVRERDRQMINVLLSALATHQDETPAHVERIGASSAELAKYLRWGNDALSTSSWQPNCTTWASWHSDHIVKKTEKLTPDEFDIVKTHTRAGARILDKSDLPIIRMARDIALCHHECWDGSGYPAGLSRELIPESARIVAIVDVFRFARP